MKKTGLLALALVLSHSAFASVRYETLTDGWNFRLGGESNSHPVQVPHDWGIEKGFLKVRTCSGQGDLPFVGKGCYRRSFDGFAPPEGGRTYLTLDGVQCRSVVKLNGKVVGGRPFGYASETIDVTDALKPSGNILEVVAENVPGSSRWYPGSGIFRDVTVRVCPPDHVKPNTLFVRTVEASDRQARMAVSFEWRGGVSNFFFTVENPRLWSPESPSLYELEVFGEKFRYGIRTAVFDPRKGFFLNGVHRQMRGVCMHHDLGPIGAVFDRDFARRQLTLLKEMGCDAIRTAHNPPAAALLDLCDEMGVMVMDEAFDMWERSKGDYAQFFKEWHVRDLEEFVRRDRSHPCVVMWSIGNEVFELSEADPANAIRIAKELTAIVKANDPTRPVTFGSWWAAPMWNGCQHTVDAFGANYLPFKYAEFSRRNPTVGLVATETSSCVSSRGEYFFPVVASPINGEGDLRRRRDEGRQRMIRGGQMSGYDLWGPHPNDYPPDVEFEHQERNPQVYGEFVWTGFDYLGEPDPCAQSGGRSSYFGIFDLAGIPKDRYWLYKSHWRPNERVAHILPHWTWPGREGEVTPVHVYTSGDEAELFVNGVSKGRKRRGAYEYRFRWDEVRYEPGELRVKTWKDGEEWAEDVVRTASGPVRVERTERRFGRLTFVTFALKDKNGEVCPNADRTLSFATKPGTRLVSLCNGDATSRENFKGSSMRTFHGLLVAAVEGSPEGLELRQGVSPMVEEWESGRRASVLKWFEEHQFGRTPIGKLKDQKFEETAVVFEEASIRINITCRLPEGASAENPVPVFLFGDHRGGDKPPYVQQEYPDIPTNAITSRGYAYVRWNFNDVCPNVNRGGSYARWSMGIIAWQALGDKAATNVVRGATSWGTIGAWAWGNSRVMDWIGTRPELDATRVAVVGHSRGGKTALWTAAQDRRFAMAVSSCSGCGGASLGRARGPKAESIKAILRSFPNWFCPAMEQLIGRDAKLEHDADDLLKLIAPRLVYVTSGSEDDWAGPASEKAAADAARDLYRAYGVEDRVGYHCHKGPHKLLPVDWARIMDFADKHLKAFSR